jgi:DEAD/DEAH box helicase domain-containing protein
MEPPALKVNIRSGGGDQVLLVQNDTEVGTMERWRAMTSAHEGAVYLHRGASYVVKSLNLDTNRAEVEERSVDYYTQSMVQSVLDPQEAFREAGAGVIRAGLAGVTVTDLVTGYRSKSLDGDTVLSIDPLDLPPETYSTICIRIDLPDINIDLDGEKQIGGIHGLEHALLAVAPILAGCDRSDLGSAWYTVFHDTMRPAVFVFDKTPGGVGLCEKLFESLTGWIHAALQLLTSCPCEAGCPSCLLSSRCESYNEMLDKPEAIRMLQAGIQPGPPNN